MKNEEDSYPGGKITSLKKALGQEVLLDAKSKVKIILCTNLLQTSQTRTELYIVTDSCRPLNYTPKAVIAGAVGFKVGWCCQGVSKA